MIHTRSYFRNFLVRLRGDVELDLQDKPARARVKVLQAAADRFHIPCFFPCYNVSEILLVNAIDGKSRGEDTMMILTPLSHSKLANVDDKT